MICQRCDSFCPSLRIPSAFLCESTNANDLPIGDLKGNQQAQNVREGKGPIGGLKTNGEGLANGILGDANCAGGGLLGGLESGGEGLTGKLI